VRGSIGTTGHAWYRFLLECQRRSPADIGVGLEEINFWKPSGGRFAALEPGESFAKDGPHDVRNGILLRSDLHRLFDHGYVTVTPDHRFEVSGRVREDWENGRAYYNMKDWVVHVPTTTELRPGPGLLRWHNEPVILG
jgi:hypothetical protein